MPQFSKIRLDLAPPIATITLAHPPLNVIDPAMAHELQQCLADLEPRPDLSAIVFQGDARAFSAGVDIEAHLPERIQEMLTSFHAAIRAVAGSRKVTIAAVQGACLGGGAELASVCDIVHTARDATWGFPEIKLGCYPPVAAVVLPALVGQKRATELIFTGRQITGDEAVVLGLATRSARAEELSNLVDKTLADLRQLSPAALVLAKKAFYAWDSIHFDKGLARAEKIYLEEVISTADAREGIMAFLKKRTPKWSQS